MKKLILFALIISGCSNPYKWEAQTVCIQEREYIIEWDILKVWRVYDTGNNCQECKYEITPPQQLNK